MLLNNVSNNDLSVCAIMTNTDGYAAIATNRHCSVELNWKKPWTQRIGLGAMYTTGCYSPAISVYS